MTGETWYTREESETTEKFGSIPDQRPIDELLNRGIIVVDKPFGPTSNQVSHWMKEELDRQKTGHFGTLDPNATGVLPVGLDKGTRIQDSLSKAKKEYIFEAELSEIFDYTTVEKTLREFKGVNKQIPPEKSAVKREEREREVYEIELIEKDGKTVLGRVKCESGFYVRVLISQLGEKLGADAEMTELRRTQQGNINEKQAHSLQDIVDAYEYYKNGDEEKFREIIQPIETAVSHLKKVVIKDSAVNAIANGADLGANGIAKLQEDIKEEEKIAVMTLKGELVALAEADMDSEKMYSSDEKAATLLSVHMDPSKYPKRWKQ